MAFAGVPVEVARPTSDGATIYPGGFVLILPNADSAQKHPAGKAYVFCTSTRKERGIQQMEQQAEKLSAAANHHSANASRTMR